METLAVLRGFLLGERRLPANFPCPKPPVDVPGNAGMEAKKKSTTLVLLPPR
jgi:hypothetical protein